MAAAIDRSERTVEKWLDGTSQPGALALLRLIQVYGVDFLLICLPGTAWLSAAADAARRAALNSELLQIEAELARIEGKN